jgi:hypothetical protein
MVSPEPKRTIISHYKQLATEHSSRKNMKRKWAKFHIFVRLTPSVSFLSLSFQAEVGRKTRRKPEKKRLPVKEDFENYIDIFTHLESRPFCKLIEALRGGKCRATAATTSGLVWGGKTPPPTDQYIMKSCNWRYLRVTQPNTYYITHTL